MTNAWAWMVVCLSLVHIVAAQDSIYIGEDFSHCTRLQGEVLDYTGDEVVLKIPGGGERRFPSDRVLKVESVISAEQRAGDAKFAEGQWQAALNEYLAAGPKEQRRWVRRQIMAQIIWCHRYLNQDDLAGQYFLALLADDPKTPYFGAIPLAWVSREVPPPVQNRAKEWLQSGSKPAMLLGASQLLASPHRTEAVQALESLRFDTDDRIAMLARAQLWRTQGSVTAPLLVDWEKAIAQMPDILRAGPYFLLGGGYSRLLDREQAALAYMRVPVLFPEQRSLAARCLAEAATECERLGREGDARLLRRELLQKYPASPEASEAARLPR